MARALLISVGVISNEMVSVTAKEAGDKWKGFALFEVRDSDRPGTPGEKATVPTLTYSRAGQEVGWASS